MTKYRGPSHEGPARTAAYPLSRLSPPHDLVSMAEEIAAADSVLGAVASAELESIAAQIRSLQERAARALERVHRDAELHRADCKFKKQPGHVYHLYARPNGQRYFSLLSPEDWKGSPPHAFVASFRLEADMRFTPLAEVEERDRERSAFAQLLPRTRE